MVKTREAKPQTNKKQEAAGKKQEVRRKMQDFLLPASSTWLHNLALYV